MQNEQICYAIKNNLCIIKLSDEIKYTMSMGLDAVINHAFNDENVENFVVDLTETIYIDSTNLGLIAKIARWTHLKNLPTPTIFSSNENVNVVLKSMGFEKVFQIIYGKTSNIKNLITAENRENDEMNIKKIILEAHKILMEMNEKNREEFHSVVELLNKEI